MFRERRSSVNLYPTVIPSMRGRAGMGEGPLKVRTMFRERRSSVNLYLTVIPRMLGMTAIYRASTSQ